ncbi:MAG TPA: hypothetical protein VFA05_03860 [Gaiellaceae bacterium]|nr:hypothetical protein [Gaiellaceae bacterium]
MNVEPHPRGAGLLLLHCSPVAGDRRSAYTRLEEKLGGELARLLVCALARSQGRRGTSSP